MDFLNIKKLLGSFPPFFPFAKCNILVAWIHDTLSFSIRQLYTYVILCEHLAQTPNKIVTLSYIEIQETLFSIKV